VAKHVPAAAVIRVLRALFGFIWCKGFLGGLYCWYVPVYG